MAEPKVVQLPSSSSIQKVIDLLIIIGKNRNSTEPSIKLYQDSLNQLTELLKRGSFLEDKHLKECLELSDLVGNAVSGKRFDYIIQCINVGLRKTKKGAVLFLSLPNDHLDQIENIYLSVVANINKYIARYANNFIKSEGIARAICAVEILTHTTSRITTSTHKALFTYLMLDNPKVKTLGTFICAAFVNSTFNWEESEVYERYREDIKNKLYGYLTINHISSEILEKVKVYFFAMVNNSDECADLSKHAKKIITEILNELRNPTHQDKNIIVVPTLKKALIEQLSCIYTASNIEKNIKSYKDNYKMHGVKLTHDDLINNEPLRTAFWKAVEKRDTEVLRIFKTMGIHPLVTILTTIANIQAESREQYINQFTALISDCKFKLKNNYFINHAVLATNDVITLQLAMEAGARKDDKGLPIFPRYMKVVMDMISVEDRQYHGGNIEAQNISENKIKSLKTNISTTLSILFANIGLNIEQYVHQCKSATEGKMRAQCLKTLLLKKREISVDSEGDRKKIDFSVYQSIIIRFALKNTKVKELGKFICMAFVDANPKWELLSQYNCAGDKKMILDTIDSYLLREMIDITLLNKNEDRVNNVINACFKNCEDNDSAIDQYALQVATIVVNVISEAIKPKISSSLLYASSICSN